MLKKIGRDLLIVLGILLLAASTSRTFMAWIYEQRVEKETWWGVHQAVDGDLVEMAYLDRVSKFRSAKDYTFEKHPVETGKTDLYLWGDSYVWKIPDTAYAAVRNFKFGWRYRDNIEYTLDTVQKNILLIEIAERYVRSYFSSTDIFEHVRKAQSPSARLLPEPSTHYARMQLPEMEWLFNENINQNLEFNLFNYNFINTIRHSKASMNYYLFSRASGNVVISDNGQQLFLKETVTGKNVENSYYPVSDEEIRRIVGTLNSIYDHYLQEGFNEVYLSIIPNPSTILQSTGYNQLIPRIENDPALKMKKISVYQLYNKENKTIYRPGDTHWNNEGLQLWLGQVNKMLIEQNAN